MALIQDISEECITSPLEWFKVLPTQTAIEKSTTVEYQSLTALRQDVPIEFYVPATTEDYLDLHSSRLFIKFRIVKSTGVVCGAGDVAAPINDLLNSLWANVELYLNDRLISHSNNMHGYLSIFSHLIHDSEESLESERAMRLIYKDTPGQMDCVTANKPNWNHRVLGFDWKDDGAPFTAADLSNHGLYQRYRYTNQSNTVELMGPLRIDMFEQDRYLPNGIDIKLRFHRRKELLL